MQKVSIYHAVGEPFFCPFCGVCTNPKYVEGQDADECPDDAIPRDTARIAALKLLSERLGVSEPPLRDQPRLVMREAFGLEVPEQVEEMGLELGDVVGAQRLLNL